MSRSRKKRPFVKIAGNSDKHDRSIANRKFRRIAKERISHDEDPPVHLNEVSSTWSFSSDGLAVRIRAANSSDPDDMQHTKRLMRK